MVKISLTLSAQHVDLSLLRHFSIPGNQLFPSNKKLSMTSVLLRLQNALLNVSWPLIVSERNEPPLPALLAPLLPKLLLLYLALLYCQLHMFLTSPNEHALRKLLMTRSLVTKSVKMLVLIQNVRPLIVPNEVI